MNLTTAVALPGHHRRRHCTQGVPCCFTQPRCPARPWCLRSNTAAPQVLAVKTQEPALCNTGPCAEQQQHLKVKADTLQFATMPCRGFPAYSHTATIYFAGHLSPTHNTAKEGSLKGCSPAPDSAGWHLQKTMPLCRGPQHRAAAAPQGWHPPPGMQTAGPRRATGPPQSAAELPLQAVGPAASPAVRAFLQLLARGSLQRCVGEGDTCRESEGETCMA